MRMLRRVQSIFDYHQDPPRAGAARRRCPLDLPLLRRAQRVGVAVDLQAGYPEARDAVAVDRPLPGEEFLDRQIIPAAGFLEAQSTVADRGNDNRLAPHDPTLGVG